MPRPTELTRSEVFEAIGRLIQDGTYPTGTRIREELGGRGSPPVLQRFLGEWYEAYGPRLAAAAAAARPAVVGADLRTQLEAATREALAEFDREQAKRLADLADREAAATAFDEALQARAKGLDERETAQRELIDDLRARVTAAEARRDSALEACARARGQRDAARRAESGLLEQLNEAQRQAVDAAALRAEMARARETAQREVARVVELARERDDAFAQAKAANAEAATLRERLETERDSHAATRLDLAATRAALDVATQQAADAASAREEQRTASEAAHLALLERVDQVQGRLDALAESATATARDMSSHFAQLQEQLTAQASRIETSGGASASPDAASPRDARRRSKPGTPRASSAP